MTRAITIQEAREIANQTMKNAEQRRIDSRSCEEPPAIDTWTSGKIVPVPENDRQIADNFLAVCSDRENVTIEWFWFDVNEWRDENDNIITVSAWRRTPMDGIDEAVTEGDRP